MTDEFSESQAAVLIGATEKMIEIWQRLLRKNRLPCSPVSAAKKTPSPPSSPRNWSPRPNPDTPYPANSFTFPRPRCVRAGIISSLSNPALPWIVPHVVLYATTPAPLAVTLQVVSIVLFTFIGYLNIGIPLAVLPVTSTVIWALAR